MLVNQVDQIPIQKELFDSSVTKKVQRFQVEKKPLDKCGSFEAWIAEK